MPLEVTLSGERGWSGDISTGSQQSAEDEQQQQQLPRSRASRDRPSIDLRTEGRASGSFRSLAQLRRSSDSSLRSMTLCGSKQQQEQQQQGSALTRHLFTCLQAEGRALGSFRSVAQLRRSSDSSFRLQLARCAYA